LARVIECLGGLKLGILVLERCSQLDRGRIWAATLSVGVLKLLEDPLREGGGTLPNHFVDALDNTLPAAALLGRSGQHSLAVRGQAGNTADPFYRRIF
jgi:hypothetical protein